MKLLNYYLMSVIAFLFMGMSTAHAKSEANLGELKLNTEYALDDDNYVYGTFTPEKDGYLQVYSTNINTLRPFLSWKGSAAATMALSGNECAHIFLLGAENYSRTYEMQVKKDVKYYLCSSTMKGDGVKVILKMEPKTVKCIDCSVKEGDVVSTAGTNYVSFNFNRPVTATSACIVYGDNQQQSVTWRASSSAYSCAVRAELKSALLNLANAGKIKEGDEITVYVKGIKEDPEDVAEGETPIVYGDCSVKVKVGKLPAVLLNATMDGVPVNSETKFLTYYAPGTGKLVLTFSHELDEEEGEAMLTFGDFDQADNGGYYREDNDEKEGNFTMQVKGNQVILDFSGKRRAVNDMVTSTESNRGADFTKINLQISKITDIYGVRANSTSSTTAGRFNYSFSLDTPETNVSSEFTPANGASLKNVDNVEIWITDEESLTYQGVVFTYDLKENGIEPVPDEEGNVDIIKEVVVDMDHLTRVADEDDTEEGAYILTVPVPEEVKNMHNVTVSLYKVTCADGKDYTNIIAAKYNVVATGINNIHVAADKAVKVYNLNGQLVREGKSLDGLHGVYVANGKKIVLK